MDGEGSVERTRRIGPGTLDIVKVDGRWAQVHSGPNESEVRFLDDGTATRMNWSEYKLVRHIDSHVRLQETLGEKFTDEELGRIRWGSEQEKDPDLIREVHVFGEYQRRTEAGS